MMHGTTNIKQTAECFEFNYFLIHRDRNITHFCFKPEGEKGATITRRTKAHFSFLLNAKCGTLMHLKDLETKLIISLLSYYINTHTHTLYNSNTSWRLAVSDTINTIHVGLGVADLAKQWRCHNYPQLFFIMFLSGNMYRTRVG